LGIAFAAKTGRSDEVNKAWGKADAKDAVGSDVMPKML